MHIVFFTHPDFTNHQSMPRYARLLSEGMHSRGHQVELITASPYFARLPFKRNLKKWMGYVDQYVLFPVLFNQKLKKYDSTTLFVFTDHGLGPWVPLVKDRKVIIHCHDFIAQQSALGLVPENPTKWSGRHYQSYIRRGFIKGNNFISISKKTQNDLHSFLGHVPVCSEVVYNGLNQCFQPENVDKVREDLSLQLGIELNTGYLLHVGGNQFYKNRKGVLEIYIAWREINNNKFPLLMIGDTPSKGLQMVRALSPYKNEIHFLDQINDQLLRKAYQGALVFLFPSLAEGFGWPIAEAMASGCPVITTDEAPMSEVAGKAGFLIPSKPTDSKESLKWAEESALVLESIVSFTDSERKIVIQNGLENAGRFDSKKMLDQIEVIYKKVIQ